LTGKVERFLVVLVSTHPLFFKKMNTFSEQILFPRDYYIPRTSPLDWMEMEWSGLGAEDEDDIAPALCGEWSCPGNCDICVTAEVAIHRIFLPIYGPVNRDGVPLGFLIVSE
jgi:hypothetical protein